MFSLKVVMNCLFSIKWDTKLCICVSFIEILNSTAKPRSSKALLTTKYTKTYTKYASTTGDARPSRPLLVGGSGVSRSLLRKAGQPSAVRPYKRVHWKTSEDQAIPQDLVSAAERARMLLISPHSKSS